MARRRYLNFLDKALSVSRQDYHFPSGVKLVYQAAVLNSVMPPINGVSQLTINLN